MKRLQKSIKNSMLTFDASERSDHCLRDKNIYNMLVNFELTFSFSDKVDLYTSISRFIIWVSVCAEAICLSSCEIFRSLAN